MKNARYGWSVGRLVDFLRIFQSVQINSFFLYKGARGILKENEENRMVLMMILTDPPFVPDIDVASNKKARQVFVAQIGVSCKITVD